jgi:GTPase
VTSTGRTAGLPVVVIAGRPNVGKSTLVNRILGRREVIVEERPGVTRDRKVVEADWLGRPFLLVDTGGWMPGGSELDAKVSRQSEKAVADADVVIMVVDATTGATEEDDRVADLLRRRQGATLVAVNKVDDTNRENAVWDFMAMGLGDPFPVSALHGRGTGDLLDKVMTLLPPAPEVDETDEVHDPQGDDGETEAPRRGNRNTTPGSTERIFAVAIVGRPNVGKSTLFNRMIGEDRAVVHDMPGTTRDTVDTVVETEAGPLRFVDTAGMRRKSRIDEGTEYYSMVRALQAVDLSDTALLVIDGLEGVTHQDQRLAERIDAAGCPVVVIVNKWELLDAEARYRIQADIGRKLRFLGESPVLGISALTGKGVHRLIPALSAAIDAYQVRVPTRRVNEAIRRAQEAQPAPHGARVLYATQGATNPPTFTLFANRELPASYLRYLERKLRETFELGNTPIKLRVRRRSD